MKRQDQGQANLPLVFKNREWQVFNSQYANIQQAMCVLTIFSLILVMETHRISLPFVSSRAD